MRIQYRLNQFWNAIKARPGAGQVVEAGQVLNPVQVELFLEMQPGEQAHSLKIYQDLVAAGENNQDLLAAALLHDVGKSRYPLAVWERTIIVIARAILPGKVSEWGKGSPRGWRRPFVIAERHAEWGAEMAAKAGSSSLTIDLIRRHQKKILSESVSGKPQQSVDELLFLLQQFDDQN